MGCHPYYPYTYLFIIVYFSIKEMKIPYHLFSSNQIFNLYTYLVCLNSKNIVSYFDFFYSNISHFKKKSQNNPFFKLFLKLPQFKKNIKVLVSDQLASILSFKEGRQLNWLQHMVLPIQLTSMCIKWEDAPTDLTPPCIV